ncbi:hypothetical protein ATN79_47135 [Paraburkholderia caribensis]|nr:hypothetical protein ATN79_47135 [Paraburkholderia caribensis]
MFSTISLAMKPASLPVYLFWMVNLSFALLTGPFLLASVLTMLVHEILLHSLQPDAYRVCITLGPLLAMQTVFLICLVRRQLSKPVKR